MIQKRALVVTDGLGVLEVFGPYEVGSEELSFDSTALGSWADDSVDETVGVEDMPLRDPESLFGWIDDPEAFYSVGDEL